MKVYADTSVFGGVFDEEFADPSKEFFAEVESGRFDLVVSAVVHAEIASAPEEVQEFFSAPWQKLRMPNLLKKCWSYETLI